MDKLPLSGHLWTDDLYHYEYNTFFQVLNEFMHFISITPNFRNFEDFTTLASERNGVVDKIYSDVSYFRKTFGIENEQYSSRFWYTGRDKKLQKSEMP